jgi:hypothetical protein
MNGRRDILIFLERCHFRATVWVIETALEHSHLTDVWCALNVPTMAL